MQNTMVRGGGDGQLGKKIEVREKNEKGERKKGERPYKCIFLGFKLKK